MDNIEDRLRCLEHELRELNHVWREIADDRRGYGEEFAQLRKELGELKAGIQEQLPA